MGRPSTQPTPLNSQQQISLQHSFLHIVNAAYPQMFGQLRTDLATQRERALELMKSLPGLAPDDFHFLDSHMRSRITTSIVERWAVNFYVSNTWIEEEAQRLAMVWISQEGNSAEYLPLGFSGETGIPAFQEVDLRIPIPLELQVERPYFSWNRLKVFLLQQVQPAMEIEFERLRRVEMESGTSVEIRFPSDVDKRMAATALYLFRGLTPEQIRDLPQPPLPPDPEQEDWRVRILRGLARERTVLNRWIQDMTQLLGLEKVRRRRLQNRRRTPRWQRS